MGIDYYQLQALWAVQKDSNFQRAAERLSITQSAVSQRIRALEDFVGSPLLIRSNPAQLTKLGQVYVSTYVQVHALYQALPSKSELKPSRLPLAVNEESFDLWFNKATISLANNQQLLFDVSIEDQDCTADLLRTAQALGCVSSEKGPIQGCYSYPLKPTKYICVAHKKFIDRFKLIPGNVEGLNNTPTAIYGPHDKIHERFLSQILKRRKIPNYDAHTIPSVRGILELIESAQVLAVMPLEYVERQIESGKLLNLFPEFSMEQNLYWHVVQTHIPILQRVTNAILDLRGV
jgi:LysR family transcriptional regulator, chromosome initiation inhibitor